MKLKALNQTHETYSKDLITKYQSLYEGGECFRKNIRCFMLQNPIESPQNYQLRLSEAHFESHINSIVNQFGSQLFSCPFIVKSDPESIDEFYSEFKEDCDLNGKDLNIFVQHLFLTSLIHRKAWVLLNLPDDANLPPENLLDYKERGLGRVWLQDIEPNEVLDWEFDEFGQFNWVITHTTECKRPDPRSEVRVMVETWKIYDQVEVETFQVVYEKGKKPKDEAIIPSLGKKKHGFPRVPLLKICLPEGLWLVNRLADAQIEHFRMSNALAFSQRSSCNQILVLKSNGDEIKQTSGFGIKIGADDDLNFISPSSDSFQVIHTQISTLKDEIYRLSQQMALAVDNSPGTIKRSGESKSKDSESTKIILSSYAEIVKGFVEEIYELVSDARGDVSVTFSIEGMDSFQVDDAQSLIESLTLVKTFAVQSKTFNKELQCKVVSVALPNLSEEIKKTIREEIQSAPDEKPEPMINKVPDPNSLDPNKKPFVQSNEQTPPK